MLVGLHAVAFGGEAALYRSAQRLGQVHVDDAFGAAQRLGGQLRQPVGEPPGFALKFVGGQMRVASPISTATPGEIRSPVKRYSRDLMMGVSNGQSAAPPSPATSPTGTCGSAK